MQNKNNKLDIIIPTIGRESLYKSVNAVSTEGNIIVVVDIKNSKSKVREDLLPKETKILYNELVSGPGGSKMLGISNSTSEFFTIMDDDDYFLPTYLTWAISKMIKEEAHWMSSHNTTISTYLFEKEYEVLSNFLDKMSRYYSFTDYNSELHKNSLCPSHLIYRTSTFKDYLLTGGFPYTGYNNDDVLPMTDFCIKYKGINHLGYGYYNYHSPNSVGRSKIDVNKIKDKVMTLSELATRGTLESLFWNLTLSNVLAQINYYNGK